MARIDAELAGLARKRDELRLAGVDALLRADDVYVNGGGSHYLMVFAFSKASSIAPTMQNACSGNASHSPATIILKPLMVSFSDTYLPGVPVKFCATVNGCDRKRWILRARDTASLSSGESSSMPRIAMMSRSSL